MKFNYQARTKEGDIRIGTVEASSKEAALILLQKYGFYITYLEEAKAPFYAREVKIFKKISLRDIALFSRQLAIMFNSRVPLVEALSTIANQTPSLGFREKILDLSKEVEGGSAFSKALSRHPQVFSPFYIAMVQAGEASGKLADSLNYLAEHLERDYYLRSKIRGAMFYPALVLLVVVIVLALMVFMVLPNFEQIFLETEAKIPAITQMVLSASRFFKKHFLFLFFGFLFFSFLILRYYKTEKGKNFFDKNSLKLPIFGSLSKTIYLSRFAENLSTLISGGIMMPQALEITGNVVGNALYKEVIFLTRDEVRKGMPISSVLTAFPKIFPPVFIQMVVVGEKTGNLDMSLMQIAIFYRKEIDREIDNLLSILEPLLIVILGGVVGGLMLSILLPLYQMLAV